MARAKSEIQDSGDAFRLLGEKLRQSAHRPNLFGYKPHPKQVVFHSSTARTRLYIGGNRSGKTTGGVIEDIWWLKGEHPYRDDVNEIARTVGCRGRVVGVDFTQGIDKIILPEFARWIPPSYLKNGSWADSYDQTRRTLTLENKSFVEFMSYDQDLDKFAGTSRHFIHFDEEPPEAIYTENRARLVDTGGSLWMTMTPVEGMTWIYDTIYMPGKKGDNGIEVIEVDMTDNPHLTPAEIEFFVSGLTEEEKEARLHGRFVQLGGVIYKQFDAKPGGLHVIDGSFTPPKDWLWTVSLDHGFNNPTAVLFNAVSPDGDAITFKEHYRSGWTVDKHAERIHEMIRELGKRPELFIADPSIRNIDPIGGSSVQNEYIKYGLPFMLANNDVKAGINRVNRYMNKKRNGKASWSVSSECYNLIKELQRYRWKTYTSKKIQSQHNPFEEPHKKDDHAADSLRYFIMSRPDLVGGYTAMADGVRQEFQEIYEGASRTLSDPGLRVADPWNKTGDLAPSRQYAEMDVNSGFDEYLGGDW